MTMGPMLVSETARALTVTVRTVVSHDGGGDRYRPKTPDLWKEAGERGTCFDPLCYSSKDPVRVFLQRTISCQVHPVIMQASPNQILGVRRKGFVELTSKQSV